MKQLKAHVIQLAINVMTEEYKLETGKYPSHIVPKIQQEISDMKMVIRKFELLVNKLDPQC